LGVGHKIVISLSAQHLWAYDNGVLFVDTPVATGRPALPTPAGDYAIFAKFSPYKFVSPWPRSSPYYYPSAWVSYAMEFIRGGYFLHDAPWRSWYGPGSNTSNGTHGCVNIPAGAMAQLYRWARIGDEVLVQW
jgi:lipoprotein-anchoring transpeptidase ErfK/SrfK